MKSTDMRFPPHAYTLRPREASDLSACVETIAVVHAVDRYPLDWPDDPVAWLSPRNLLAAWVAEERGGVLGHVLLSAPRAPRVGDAGEGELEHAIAHLWCAAAGVPLERLAEVERFFVAPSARGQGLGAAMITLASNEARARGLWPVLVVLDHDRVAMALYERLGWRRAGSLLADWLPAGESRPPLLHAYVAPAQ